MTVAQYRDGLRNRSLTVHDVHRVDALSECGAVTVGGFRYALLGAEGAILCAIPRAKGAWRGALHRDSRGRFAPPYMITSTKLFEAACTLAGALVECRDDLGRLYQILGSASSRCAICGATLTDPVSQERGIGPECAKKVASS